MTLDLFYNNIDSHSYLIQQLKQYYIQIIHYPIVILHLQQYLCVLQQLKRENLMSDKAKLLIKYKDQTFDVQLQITATVGALKKQLQKLTNKKVPLIQQQLSYLNEADGKKAILSDDQMPLRFVKLPKDKVLNLKNLGTQIRWEYVFYIEYLGPILILPIFYLIGDKQKYTAIQFWALLMGILHYLKREYQTAYVHVFSRASMPSKRVFINCVHYWLFFALLNSIELYLYPSGHIYDNWIIYILFACWCVFQFCNYKCHMILSSFRRVKQKSSESQYENQSKKRGIPYGWGFNKISCANYFWQALGWITFSILTRCWASYIFTLFSIYQMTQWAIKKHQGYKKEFGDKYPRGRKAIFPFII